MQDNYHFIFAQWMEGKLTDEEVKKRVSPEVFLSFQKLKKGLEAYAELEQPPEKSWLKLKTLIKEKKRHVSYFTVMGIAASIAAILLLFFFPDKFLPHKQEKHVLIAENFSQTIYLPDQTEVILKQHSQISYDDNWNSKRKVRLEGEAYFNVKKGKGFLVETDNGMVETIGTKFNVKSVKDTFSVVCYEGKIQVSINKLNKKLKLSAGSGFYFSSDTFKTIRTVQKSPAWIKKYEFFEKKTIGDVLQKMEKIYQIKFSTEGIDLQQKFTGKIPLNNKEKALKIVLKSMNIDYMIKSDTVVLRKKKDG